MNHRGLAMVSAVAVLVLLAPAFVFAQVAQSMPRTPHRLAGPVPGAVRCLPRRGSDLERRQAEPYCRISGSSRYFAALNTSTAGKNGGAARI